MSETQRLLRLTVSIGVFLALAGCSHAVFQQSGSGNSNAPVILAIHDTPPSGVAVPSFEATITGATLQPGNVPLITTPQTVELTQLQTNSVILSTTQVPVGTFTSLTLTFASPQFTFLNDTGVAQTVGGQVCNPNASCVVSNPTATVLTNTISFPSSLVVAQNNQTLIEADVNLNNVMQSDFSLNFSKSGAVTIAQLTGTAGSAVIDNINVTGQVGTVTASSTQFQLAGSTAEITANSGTVFQFARANCVANDFTCVASGQVVDVNLNIMSDGTLQADEIDFDDASSTQQVSGTIVNIIGTPPASVQMIVHNTVPAVASLPPGTPVTVTIGANAAFVINSGSLVLPSGLSFASTSDVMIGQEVEARVAPNSSISNGAFTTDRFALLPSQVTAPISSVNAGNQSFFMTGLSPLFTQAPTGPVIQVDAFTAAAQTLFQTTPTGTFTDLTNVTPPNNVFSVGGFLFNTTGSVGAPSIIATVVRAQVPGT